MVTVVEETTKDIYRTQRSHTEVAAWRDTRPRASSRGGGAPPRGGLMIAAARRDTAVLALRLAQQKVEDLTVDLARHAGIDRDARRMVQILACFAPIISAIEHALPEPSEVAQPDGAT